MFRRLWHDEHGAVGSAELVLIMTIMAVGVLVGMKSFRDAAVTEFADMAQALANLDQSYSYPALTVVIGDTTLTTTPSYFADQLDFCDTEGAGDPTIGSKCVNVGIAAVGEGG
jgi:Flp pilus assembly pilin Flp